MVLLHHHFHDGDSAILFVDPHTLVHQLDQIGLVQAIKLVGPQFLADYVLNVFILERLGIARADFFQFGDPKAILAVLFLRNGIGYLGGMEFPDLFLDFSLYVGVLGHPSFGIPHFAVVFVQVGIIVIHPGQFGEVFAMAAAIGDIPRLFQSWVASAGLIRADPYHPVFGRRDFLEL